MRLLNIKSRRMKEFISDDTRPPYAILSHTWGDDEITYTEWQSLDAEAVNSRAGGAKISGCCDQAAREGLEWIWVDTCCIDKTSSAEISEAINSMFKWYRDAKICYAYLVDVPSPSSVVIIEDRLRASRWFTRGWTLQELIAPMKLSFYSQDWQLLGTKADFAATISSITRIHPKYLDGNHLDQASIAQKMSWAAKRQTTRVEDMAYCLLGIFDINLPMIYGEGSKAFQRLQQALLTAYPADHTLFAWGTIIELSQTEITESEMTETGPIPWRAGHDPDLYGLLAASPRDFENSHSMLRTTAAETFYEDSQFAASLPTIVGNSAIRLELPRPPYIYNSRHYWARPAIAQYRRLMRVILLCNYSGEEASEGEKFMVLFLRYSDNSSLSRTRELSYMHVDDKREMLGWKKLITLRASPERRLRSGDIIFRRLTTTPCSTDIHFGDPPAFKRISDDVVWFHNARLLRSNWHGNGTLGAFMYELHVSLGPEPLFRGFSIVWARFGGQLEVSFVPVYRFDGPDEVQGEYKGVMVNWSNVEKCFTARPKWSYRMRGGSDMWVLDEKPFPSVCIRVDRVVLDGGEGGHVDVADLIVDAPGRDYGYRQFVEQSDGERASERQKN